MTKLVQVVFTTAVIVLALWIAGQLVQQMAGGLMRVFQ